MNQYESLRGGENMAGEAAFREEGGTFEVKVNLGGQIIREITIAGSEKDAKTNVAYKLQKENPTLSYVVSRVMEGAVLKKIEKEKPKLRVVKGGKTGDLKGNAESPEQPELF